jgi:hypothetical protein
MQLAQPTPLCPVVAWLYAQRAVTHPETVPLLAFNYDRPTACLCCCDWFNPVGGVGSRFNYLVVNKDRRLNEQRYARLQAIDQGARKRIPDDTSRDGAGGGDCEGVEG